ncbi:MAG: protein kinase [Muribaculaceae bacterium]|nr:protein kinase [Muribaculaceae bacterium]
MHKKKALPSGTRIIGGKSPILITELLSSDSQGFLYKGHIQPDEKGESNGKDVVVREHFMVYCSDRGPDGMTVVTPEDIEPTVESCLENFKEASELRREISTTHAAIIDVIDVFGANNTYYYVVEYLNGPTLEEYIEKNGPLTLDEVRRVLGPIIRGLVHFHMHSALHTDVHPRHIRFTSDSGLSKTVLFSLYTSIHFDEEGRRLWSVQNINCREGYAPPEQYSEIENFLPQVDIYALAATIVYALTGKHLPDSRTLDENILRDFLPPAMPEVYVSALTHALSPDYTTRTVSVRSLFDEMNPTFDIRQREAQDIFRSKGPELNKKNDGKRVGIKVITVILAIIAAIIAILTMIF